MHPLKNILNRFFWDKAESPNDYELSFVHRGAPDNTKTIPASSVVKVGGSWFAYRADDNDDNGETMIPFHRILKIRNIRTGQVLWKSRLRVAD